MDEKIKNFFDNAFEFYYDLLNLFEKAQKYHQYLVMRMPFEELEKKSEEFYVLEKEILERNKTEITGSFSDRKSIEEKLENFFSADKDRDKKVGFCLMVAVRLLTLRELIDALMYDIKNGITYEDYVAKEKEIDKYLKEAEQWKNEMVWRIAENTRDWYLTEISHLFVKKTF